MTQCSTTFGPPSKATIFVYAIPLSASSIIAAVMSAVNSFEFPLPRPVPMLPLRSISRKNAVSRAFGGVLLLKTCFEPRGIFQSSLSLRTPRRWLRLRIRCSRRMRSSLLCIWRAFSAYSGGRRRRDGTMLLSSNFTSEYAPPSLNLSSRLNRPMPAV